jgi:hypothetical protein
MLPLVLLSAARVFEPPDLWHASIVAAFGDRAPRIEGIDGGDQQCGRCRLFQGEKQYTKFGVCPTVNRPQVAE